jgi:hypothetical protein
MQLIYATMPSSVYGSWFGDKHPALWSHGTSASTMEGILVRAFWWLCKLIANSWILDCWPLEIDVGRLDKP